MFGLGGGMWGQQLQKLQQKMQARQLSPGEQRYQSAQPFDAIRQQLMQQGVGVTPGLMQSYQNQAGAQGASPVGGLMGGQVVEQDAAGNRANALFAKRRAGADHRSRMVGRAGDALAANSTYQASLLDPGKAPKMAGGSFYQQSLSGTGLKDWKWNKTARQGTQSYQSPY